MCPSLGRGRLIGTIKCRELQLFDGSTVASNCFQSWPMFNCQCCRIFIGPNARPRADIGLVELRDSYLKSFVVSFVGYMVFPVIGASVGVFVGN